MIKRRLKKSDFATPGGAFWATGLLSNGHFLVRASALLLDDPARWAESIEVVKALLGETRALPASAPTFLDGEATPAVRTPWSYQTRAPKGKGKGSGTIVSDCAIYRRQSDGRCLGISRAYADLLFGDDNVLAAADGSSLFSLERDAMCMGVQLGATWGAWHWPRGPFEELTDDPAPSPTGASDGPPSE